MGVLTLAALIVAVISGAIIALGGVSFWHTNSFGAFMNSIHFWSVQAMFLFMAVHFITNFFTMGWRGCAAGPGSPACSRSSFPS